MKENMPALSSRGATFETEVDMPEGSEQNLQIFESIREDPERFIDKGGAATIHRIAPGICVKAMRNRHSRENAHEYNLGASPEQEAAFLDRLDDFEVAGVRTPKYVGSVIERGQSDRAFLIMEELNAFALIHVLSNEYQDLGEDLPADFDVEAFFDALNEYFEKLHGEQRIAHGDIAARNIMIDRKTKLPYVIDFGRAIDFHNNPADPRLKEVNPNKDLEELDRLEQQVQNYIKTGEKIDKH